jgi:hypothetical protein
VAAADECYLIQISFYFFVTIGKAVLKRDQTDLIRAGKLNLVDLAQ